MLNFVHDGYQLIIYWSPKCGCTSLRRYIEQLYTGQDCSDYDAQINMTKYTRKLIPYQKYQDYIQIWVVRNPLSRLVTFFAHTLYNGCLINKFQLSDEQFIEKIRKVIAPFMTLPLSGEIIISIEKLKKSCTFRHFVELISLIPTTQYEFHLSPQVSMFPLEAEAYQMPHYTQIKFTEIIRLEDANLYFQKLSQKFGVNYQLPKQNTHNVNYSQAVQSVMDIDIVEYIDKWHTVPQFEYFYDQTLIDTVKQIYAEDFYVYQNLSIPKNSIDLDCIEPDRSGLENNTQRFQ